ncbi:MAG: T9SS type A sorting domain-containing protein [Bacteroidia bacterium]
MLMPLWLLGQSVDHSVLNSSGGVLKTAGVSLHSNVGELATTKVNAANRSITQGFFQPEWQIISNLSTFFPEASVEIFPNPTRDVFSIRSETIQFQKITIFNSQGQVVLSQSVSTQPLSLQHLPSGLYYVNLVAISGRSIGTFKLLKI